MGYPNYPDNRLIVNGVDLTTKFKMVLADGYTLKPPSPKTYLVDIPGGNGKLDLTESLLGDTAFNNRTQEFIFYVIYPTSFETVKTQVSNYLHGRAYDYTLTMDPEYTYHGRFTVSEYKHKAYAGNIVGTIKVTIESEPFKHKATQTFRANALGGGIYSLPSGRERVRPTIETDSFLKVISKGKLTNLPQGTWTVNDILFENGDNELYLNSYDIRNITWGDLRGSYLKNLDNQQEYFGNWCIENPVNPWVFSKNLKVGYKVTPEEVDSGYTPTDEYDKSFIYDSYGGYVNANNVIKYTFESKIDVDKIWTFNTTSYKYVDGVKKGLYYRYELPFVREQIPGTNKFRYSTFEYVVSKSDFNNSSSLVLCILIKKKDSYSEEISPDDIENYNMEVNGLSEDQRGFGAIVPSENWESYALDIEPNSTYEITAATGTSIQNNQTPKSLCAVYKYSKSQLLAMDESQLKYANSAMDNITTRITESEANVKRTYIINTGSSAKCMVIAGNGIIHSVNKLDRQLTPVTGGVGMGSVVIDHESGDLKLTYDYVWSAIKYTIKPNTKYKVRTRIPTYESLEDCAHPCVVAVYKDDIENEYLSEVTGLDDSVSYISPELSSPCLGMTVEYEITTGRNDVCIIVCGSVNSTSVNEVNSAKTISWGEFKQKKLFEWYKSNGDGTYVIKTWGDMANETWGEISDTSWSDHSYKYENTKTVTDTYIKYDWGDL